MRTSARSFGAPGGGHHEHISSKSDNMNYQIPNNADLKAHIPEKYIPNDNFLAWVSGRFAADRKDFKLNNDKVNKYSAYHHLGTNPLLQNPIVLFLIRFLTAQEEGNVSMVK